MKDQINKIVGQIVIFLGKVAAIVVLCTIITVGVFEDQKEEIWLEAVESFQLLYDTKETELYEQFGIVDKDDAEQWQWENQTTNIAYAKGEKEYPAPQIIASASIICIRQLLPDDAVEQDLTQELHNKVNQCIKQQINDAIVIGEVYMKEVSELPKGPTKTILQAIVVECHKGNTIKEQGVTDYTGTLQCIKSDMGKLKEMLDSELGRIKTKNGV